MYSKTLLLCPFALCSALLSQERPSAALMRTLNNDVLRLESEYFRAAGPGRVNFRPRMAELLTSRQTVLSDLIAADAREAVQHALPQEEIDRLAAAFPAEAYLLERHGALHGRLETVVEDGVDFASHREIHRLHTDDGRVLEMHFAGTAPESLTCNTEMTAEGVIVGGRFAATQTVSQAALAGCSTIGEQRIAVILVNFPSATLSASVNAELIKGIFLGNAYTTSTSSPDTSVSDFWMQNSDGKTWVAAPGGVGGLTVVGPYMLSQNYDYCSDSSALRQAAYAAANGALNFAEFHRVAIVVPNYLCDGKAGVASLGCYGGECPGDGACGLGWTWLRSDQIASRSLGVRLVTHELGHSLGMNHAGSRDHGADVVGPIGTPGTRSEYGDKFGTLGFWNFGFYNAQHSSGIGWLTSTNIQTVTASGTYSIQGFNTGPGGMKVLKVRRGASTDNAWLWVAYYPNSPIYLSQLSSQVFCGALIHYQDAATPGGKTDLLDFTTATADFNDPALCAGQTWQDPYTNLSITVNSAASNALSVTVSYATVPCTEANPTVTLAPSSLSVYEGFSGNYSLTVKSNDSASCAARSYAISRSLAPASALVTLGAPGPVTLNPGAQTTVTLTASAAAGATGSYTTSASASALASAGGSSTGNSTAGLAVSVAPPSAPSAPASLTAAGTYSGNGRNRVLMYVRLTWSDMSGNETGFRIERCMETGSGALKTCTYSGAALATVGAGVTAYSDTTAVRGNNYRYRVRSENSYGSSGWVETSTNP